MEKKNKGGRPRKSAAEKQKYAVKFMVCAEEYRSLKAKADSAGMRLSEFARLAATGCRIIPRLTLEEANWLRKLSGMSNNLNQLASSANKSGFKDVATANGRMGLEIFEIVKRIRYDGKDHKR